MVTLPQYDEALTQILNDISPTASSQATATDQATGRVLAEPIIADRDLPPFHRAAMDGYAVCTHAWRHCMPVHAGVQAGHRLQDIPSNDACIEIATGAAVPEPFDAVIPYELSDRKNPVTFHMDSPPSLHANIHRQAADATSGTTIVEAGTLLGTAELGLAAMVGVQNLVVQQQPRVHILTSGDEVVSEGVLPATHQIRNSNRPMIAEIVSRCGGVITRTEHLVDTPEQSRAAMQAADAEVLVTTGGISAGRADHVAESLTAAGCQWTITGVAMQPGKPVRIGRLDHRVIVCLPGNPVSALVCGTLFLAPILRQLLHQPAGPLWQKVSLQHDLKGNVRRTAFRASRRTSDSKVAIPHWQGSGDLSHAAGTHGIVELPRDEVIRAGTDLRFTPWP